MSRHLINRVNKVRSMETAGWMIARMAAPLAPTKVAICRLGCSCSEEIRLRREVRVDTRSAENIVTAAWWNRNSGSDLRGRLELRERTMKDGQSAQDWDIRLTYSHGRLCLNFSFFEKLSQSATTHSLSRLFSQR